MARLCRFVFLDLIRGEPDFWESGDVKKAAFSLEQRGSTDGNVAFAFKGDFKNSVWAFMGGRGVEGTISGEFTVDVKAEKIFKFRAYAKCKAYGASEWTQRGLPHGTFPLVFAMTEANDDPLAHEIPPAAVSRKADYSNPKFPAFNK